MKNLVIVPAWNEVESLERVVAALRRDAPGFDFVIVNDGSTDGTAALCRRNGWPLLDLPVNLGIGGAVQTGYRYAVRAGYDTATQFDGDGQHDAAALPAMLAALRRDGLDMVVGSRFIERKGFQSGALRRVGIRFLSRLVRVLTGRAITDPTSGFRMVSRRLAELFAEDYPNDYPEPESVVRALARGAKVAEIPVVMNDRLAGTSSISMRRSVYYMVKVSFAMVVARLRK
ncbi:MAG: glycosyltransferase family 2 protein [Kiritimatiellae bacterium]|nr:glycosyltransferase family 2 protein [Kiritimatiellia bacterium]